MDLHSFAPFCSISNDCFQLAQSGTATKFDSRGSLILRRLDARLPSSCPGTSAAVRDPTELPLRYSISGIFLRIEWRHTPSNPAGLKP